MLDVEGIYTMLIFNQYFRGVLDSVFGGFFDCCNHCFNCSNMFTASNFSRDSVAFVDYFTFFVFDLGHFVLECRIENEEFIVCVDEIVAVDVIRASVQSVLARSQEHELGFTSH
jgi:hypothetical protein